MPNVGKDTEKSKLSNIANGIGRALLVNFDVTH